MPFVWRAGPIAPPYEWKVVAVRDVLAPINAREPMYPDPRGRRRNFGKSGISFATDRWELRRALVLEGRLREGHFEDGAGADRFQWYVDLQTLFPLDYVGLSDDPGEPGGGVAIFVGRWGSAADLRPGVVRCRSGRRQRRSRR